ncbi:MAG TPA: ABC transporter permease, partial [Thermoanaerobaculia bacterium]|nr:ABC transporter permease [Thermoanaerobaculia bacterium]
LAGRALWELRQATRSWRRSRGLFAALVITLGLALAGATVVASVLGTLLSPLPVHEAERLVSPLALRDGDAFLVSARDVIAWRQAAPALSSIGAALPRSLNLVVDGRALRVAAAEITPDYLSTLGVDVALGRALAEGDLGEGAPVLVGHRLWRSVLDGDPRLAGRSVLLDGRRHPVVGVLPPRFDLPFGAQVWLPLRLRPEVAGPGSRGLSAVARLARGVEPEAAEREVRQLAARLERDHPESHRGWSATLVDLRSQLLGDLDGRLRPTVRVLALTVCALLLLAFANAFHLLAARAVRRRRELAVRAALGADRSRLLVQLGLETLLPVGAAAALGLVSAHLAIGLLAGWTPLRGLALDSASELRIDAGSAGAIALLALALGVTLTLLSARRARSASLTAGPDLGGDRVVSGAGMARLIATEVALSVLLLTLAGWLFSSLQRLAELELGFDPRPVTVARLALPELDYPTPADRARRVEELVARLAALPEVAAAGATTNAPLDALSSDARVWARAPTVPQDPDDLLFVADRAVTPGYLEALRVRLQAGRLIDGRDHADSEPVAVISRDLAERLWPGESALGRQLRRGGPDSEAPWRTVVGVVEPVKEDRGAFRRDRPVWYVPYPQLAPDRPLTIALRAPGASDRWVAAVRAALTELDPALPVFDAGALEDQVSELRAGEQVAGVLVGLFALAALLLQAGGTFAVVWHGASERRRELGVRLALGATGRRLLLEACRRPLRATLAGLLAGSLAALAVGRGLATLLAEVRLLDPRVLGGVAILTVAIGLAAAWLPARAAQRDDPLSSLVAE